jgi:amidase
LVELGHEVIEIECPFPADAADHFLTVWSCGAAALPLTPQMEELIRPITRWFREQGKARTTAQYQQSLTYLRESAMASIAATNAYDVVLTPTTGQSPRLIGELRNDADPAAESDALITYSCFTPPYNVSGQPAMSLPLHWDAAGLPIGVQLVAKPYDEVTLLQLAAQLEQALPWHDKKPEIW